MVVSAGRYCDSGVNPTDAIADFDPQYISDAQLGGP